MKREKIPDPYNKMKRIKAPLTPEEAKRAKVRITTYLDGETLDMIRQVAQDSGNKYQTVLNQILRDYFFGIKKGLIARVARLEKAVFKKKAA